MLHATANLIFNLAGLLALAVIAGLLLPNLGTILDAILEEGEIISRSIERNDR